MLAAGIYVPKFLFFELVASSKKPRSTTGSLMSTLNPFIDIFRMLFMFDSNRSKNFEQLVENLKY